MIPKDNECYNGYFILEPDASLFDVGFGNHEFDYVFKIKVTNNAMLVSYQEFQVRVCFLKVETWQIQCTKQDFDFIYQVCMEWLE